MKSNDLIFLSILGSIVQALAGPAWAGDQFGSATVTLNITALPNCDIDSSALIFDLGSVDAQQQEQALTKLVKVTCDAPAKATLQGTLQRGSKAEAGGEIPSLQGCENGGQGSCFDLTQAGHAFDVPAAGTDIGIRVAYRSPAGLGTDTFSGQLTVSWP
ncbi:hypothetical protein MRM75_06640 [bacterium 19CA06SA08-2]|uniref:Spore coat protein U domain-containing protein n=1 Tax=bacterium 19CA06SA08-2 TaxID=2920658 RepID=A0AAU6UA17_UNCXX